MNTLIIEDDDLKYGVLFRFLSVTAPQVNIIRASSYQAGVERLVERDYDFVLLDMTLPVSDLDPSPVGMDFLPFGGELILREAKRRGITAKIVVVTQYSTFVRNNEEVSFEQLRDEVMKGYPSLVKGCVRLDRASEMWKSEISEPLAKPHGGLKNQ